MRATRHLPVPIHMPEGKVGRGHLLPELRSLAKPARGFVRVPGGKTVEYGMVAFLGSILTPEDMLKRWEAEVGAVDDRHTALATLSRYVAALADLRIGNVVQIRYDELGFADVVKIQNTPPTSRQAPLPQLSGPSNNALKLTRQGFTGSL